MPVSVWEDVNVGGIGAKAEKKADVQKHFCREEESGSLRNLLNKGNQRVPACHYRTGRGYRKIFIERKRIPMLSEAARSYTG